MADPRLDGVVGTWTDGAGNLLMPAVQFDRTPGMGDGVDAVRLPTVVYRVAIGAATRRAQPENALR